jgi:hypothetical protein
MVFALQYTSSPFDVMMPFSFKNFKNLTDVKNYLYTCEKSTSALSPRQGGRSQVVRQWTVTPLFAGSSPVVRREQKAS